jgi:hypothetical protein
LIKQRLKLTGPHSLAGAGCFWFSLSVGFDYHASHLRSFAGRDYCHDPDPHFLKGNPMLMNDDPDFDLTGADLNEMDRIAAMARRLAATAKSLKPNYLEADCDALDAKAAQQEATMANPMWRDHNCWKCREGQKVCPRGGSHRCEYPVAKNN